MTKFSRSVQTNVKHEQKGLKPRLSVCPARGGASEGKSEGKSEGRSECESVGKSEDESENSPRAVI